MTFDRSGPKFDFPATAQQGPTLLIASVQRSGSTLLSRALWSTGVAGAPAEYLNPLTRRRFDTRFERKTLSEYVADLRRHRTSPNGVFSVHAHWTHFRRLVGSGADVAGVLGVTHVVAVTRLDQVGQAVSLEIARQTGRWSSDQQESKRRPRYRRRAIAARIGEIRSGEAGWHRWLAGSGIEPLRLSYEDIADDLDGAVRAVLAHLGLPEAATATIDAPSLEPVEADLKFRWESRFRGPVPAESADQT